jgi:hypothetical protein
MAVHQIEQVAVNSLKLGS